MSNKPIVFVHGLWIHPTAWEPWADFFRSNGYECYTPPWPGDGSTVADSRTKAVAIANRGVREVADSHATFISKLSQPPILIGHSFGGLLVQNLLGRNVASAAIAIDPAPIKGVWQLPFSALKSALPVLSNPFNLTKAVSLNYNQFRYAFGNAVSESEAKDMFDKNTIPAPGRPLFQAATAAFNPWSETKVNTTNANRGPLLIVSGENDHIVPPVLSKATFKKYRKSPAVTEFKSFANRGHSLTMDHGWKEIAEYSLDWLKKKGL